MSGVNVFKRLPTDVVPSNYNIILEPDLEKFIFKGSEDITLQVLVYWSFIVLENNMYMK